MAENRSDSLSGSNFEEVDNRLMVLKLVEMELSDVMVFAMDQKMLVHPSELFYKNDMMVMRSMFKLVTNLSLDMMNGGMEIFLPTAGVNAEAAMVVPEISLACSLRASSIHATSFLP